MLSRNWACASRSVTVPVLSSRRSASVDLPWSMWAMMEKLRRWAFSAGIDVASTSRRLPNTPGEPGRHRPHPRGRSGDRRPCSPARRRRPARAEPARRCAGGPPRGRPWGASRATLSARRGSTELRSCSPGLAGPCCAGGGRCRRPGRGARSRRFTSVSRPVPMLIGPCTSRWAARRLARATSGDEHEVARLLAVPLMVQGSPRSSRSLKMATTPASPCGFCRGP